MIPQVVAEWMDDDLVCRAVVTLDDKRRLAVVCEVLDRRTDAMGNVTDLWRRPAICVNPEHALIAIAAERAGTSFNDFCAKTQCEVQA